MQNGAAYHRETVAEIKANAKETANQVKGASATSLLASARSQIRLAQAKENEGDLKGALTAYTKSASLVQMLMDTAEFKAESGRKGPLFKEFMTFQQVRHSRDYSFASLTSRRPTGGSYWTRRETWRRSWWSWRSLLPSTRHS